MSANRKRFQPWAETAGKNNNVKTALVLAVIHQESGFKENAVSSAGAQGLMQLTPQTAKHLGVRNAMNPKENINGGAKYLRQLLNMFKGDTQKALAAYNAGPSNVIKYKGVPPYKETKAYVKNVMKLMRDYEG